MTASPLQQTLPHLLERWLPINSDIAASIRKRFQATSKPDSVAEETLRDLRQDPALLGWCLIAQAPAPALSSAPAPARTFSTSLAAGIQKFVESDSQLQSPHQLREASPVQQQLLHKSLARTSASAVLAPYFDIDCDMACTVSALSEAGNSLIAWNYPRILAQVTERVDKAEIAESQYQSQIDTWIAKMLGFSPFLLSLAIARHCQLPDEIQIGLGQSADRLSPSVHATEAGMALKKISTFSEIYSRAVLPGASDVRTEQWDSCRRELEPTIGSNGLTLLKNATENILRRYGRILPQLVASIEVRRPVHAPAMDRQMALFQKNLHIALCSNEVQDALRQLYQTFSPDQTLDENISRLISSLAPLAGFSRGALYLIDHSTDSLVPHYSFGYTDSQPSILDSSNPLFNEDPVVLAFMSRAPVIEKHPDSQTTCLAGLIGNSQRGGVLYLEFKPEDQATHHIRPRPHFKALQQALSDALNLA